MSNAPDPSGPTSRHLTTLSPPPRSLDGGSPRHSIIESIGIHLPPKIASTHEVLAGCENISWFRRKHLGRVERLTGIRHRRLAEEDEASIELAKKAIVKCLAMSRHGPSDIDLLICCSLSRYERPDRYHTYEPAISVLLTDHFAFDRAFAFDIANGCAGMFTAIHIVDSLIKARLIGVGLVVSGEHITDLMRTAQREVTGYSDPRFACFTLGDAAAALILKEAPADGIGLHAIDLYTAAKYSDYCIARPTDQAHGGTIMFTESAKLLEVGSRHSVPDIVHALRTLRWGKEQLDHLIIHQTSQSGIDALRHVNELAHDEILHDGNVINNLSERGNTATTTHFVAVWDNILSGRIRSGDRVLFGVQGSGLTFGTAAYTFDDLPDRVRRAEARGDTAPLASTRGRARAVLHTGAPRIRIESLGVAGGLTGPDAGIRLAHMAIDRCFEHSSYTRDDVELLIYAGVHRDDFIGEPAIAAMIAGRAKLNEAGPSAASGKRTFAFDVLNSSIGFLNGCYVGTGMIRAGRCKAVMVVASEIEHNAGIPGEARLGIAEVGSAVILDHSPDGTAGFGPCVFESFTDHVGAFSSWLGHKDGKARLQFERRADLEAAYLRRIPGTVEHLLRSDGLRMEDISVILPPQISTGFVPRLADALHVGRDRFVDLGEDGRSLFSSTLASTFLNIRRDRSIVAGDIGLIINVGSGIQIGAATYYF